MAAPSLHFRSGETPASDCGSIAICRGHLIPLPLIRVPIPNVGAGLILAAVACSAGGDGDVNPLADDKRERASARPRSARRNAPRTDSN